MSINTKRDVLPIRQRRFLNKEFLALKSDLLSYANAFYRGGKAGSDFSDNGIAGLFMDVAAYVGDNMSFYLDHQFGEIFADTAVELQNIENQIRSAGVEITGNSPAVVRLTFAIQVPAQRNGNKYTPQVDALPIIKSGTIVVSNSGPRFSLTEDLDFSQVDEDGNFIASIRVSDVATDKTPQTFIMTLTGNAVSGFTRTESFTIPNEFVRFREILLGSEDVSEILYAVDTEGNDYYRVESHVDDVIFETIPNFRSDSNDVDNILIMKPAPYRYTSSTSLQTRLTKLTFGGGDADSFDNDIIPDPSKLAIPLYGKTNFTRFAIDPNKLLDTRTFGVAPQGTTITVSYRYGGGLSHNVASETIRTISSLIMTFPGNPSSSVAASVRAFTEVNNFEPARGGENAPTIDELRAKIPSARNAQKRITTREDMLARIYTMPSNLGRVFRAGIRSNPNNPQSSQLFIVSRDAERNLVQSPDTLKLNLAKFLNQYRIVPDAIDILDAPIVNIGFEFEITIQDGNKEVIIQNVIAKLIQFFDVNNFQIDQPIRISDVHNIIFNTQGVLTITNMNFRNFVGVIKNRDYSNVSINVSSHTIKGFLFPPPGGILFMKYPQFDILGRAI